MTRDQAIVRMRRMLAYNESLSQTILVDALKDAQQEAEELPELPWFLRSEVSSIVTVAGEERIPLPLNFLLETEEDDLYYFDSTLDEPWVPLCKGSLDTLRNRYSGVEDGPPKEYALDGDYFRIFPTPDDTYTLKMVYFGSDELLDSDIENGWLKHAPNLLIGKAVVLVTTGTRDQTALQLGGAMAQAALTRLMNKDTARQMQNRTVQMGGPD